MKELREVDAWQYVVPAMRYRITKRWERETVDDDYGTVFVLSRSCSELEAMAMKVEGDWGGPSSAHG